MPPPQSTPHELRPMTRPVWITTLCALMLTPPGLLLSWGSVQAFASPSKQMMTTFQTAAQHFKAKQYAEAAPLFHQAYEQDPKPVLLFNAALAELRADQLDLAKRDFEALLALPKIHPKIAARAHTSLKEIARRQAKDAQALTEGGAHDNGDTHGPQGGARQTTGPATWQAPVGWAGLGIGVLFAGLGGWMIQGALGDDADLQRKLSRSEGKVGGLDYESYERERNAISKRWGLGVGMLAGGTLIAAAGGWLVATAPAAPRLSVWKRGRGLSLQVAF